MITRVYMNQAYFDFFIVCTCTCVRLCALLGLPLRQDGAEGGLAAPEARGKLLRLGREQQGHQV
jgi:hypothetical protein